MPTHHPYRIIDTRVRPASGRQPRPHRLRMIACAIAAALAVAAVIGGGGAAAGERPGSARPVPNEPVGLVQVPGRTDLVDVRLTEPHSYQPAGTDYGLHRADPDHDWRVPTLASTVVNGRTRLLRAVSTGAADNGRNVTASLQYLDLGSPAGWQPIRMHGPTTPNFASFNNFIQSGNTLHTFDTTLRRLEPTGPPYLVHRTSVDGGRTWSTSYSRFDIAGSIAAGSGIHAVQGIIRLGSSWLMPVYYHRCVDVGCRTERSVVGLAASTDQGRSWKKLALPFVSPDNDYTEGTVIRRADGRLLMAARYVFPTGPGNAFGGALVWRLSTSRVDTLTDLVRTRWAAPRVAVPVAADRLYNGLDLGILPKLTQVTQGSIMLSFGRPGNTFAWNYDGTGTNFSDMKTLNENRPTSCDPAIPHRWKDTRISVPCFAMGSSGNNAVTVTDPVHGVGYIAGDRCHDWSCETAHRSWPDVSWPDPALDRQQATWLVRFSAG